MEHGGLDQTAWELVEPFPDIHALFVLYSRLYFRSSLGACSVEWSSKRMVRCAGTCSYSKGGALIRLSEPLLKYRPALDVKETLLHEMIHAYIYLTGKSRKDGDHGPLFHQMMHDINTATFPDPERPPQGYHLSKYHTFLAEVKNYQTHHWACDGCGKMISRANNRAPQEADCQYYRKDKPPADCGDPKCKHHAHKRACNGSYIKIAEPEDHKDRKEKGKKQPRRKGGEQPKFARNGDPVPPKRPRSTPAPPAGNATIHDFFARIPEAGASPTGGASGGGSRPPRPNLAPGVRRIDDSPAAKRQLLAEAAQRRMQQAAAGAESPPNQAPTGSGGGGAVALGSGGSRAEAILLDISDEEVDEVRRVRRKVSPRPALVLARSDSTAQHFAALLSGSGSSKAAAGQGSRQQGGVTPTGQASATAAGGEAIMESYCPVCHRRWPIEEMPIPQLNVHIDVCLLQRQ